MIFVNQVCDYISKSLNIDIQYIYLTIGTGLVLFICFIIKLIAHRFINLIEDESAKYKVNQKCNMVINIIQAILLFFTWDSYIKSLMTLISFVSAAFAIALRDIIFNWFCGIYIRISKLFKVEDRIEIDNVKGDVIKLSSLNFDILEVGEGNEGQSTGIIISIPNSFIFTNKVKNLTRGFKYIWNEMTIKVDKDSDLNNTKQVLYEIVDSFTDINKVPKRTKTQIKYINSTYRIYYNNYEPIIYTEIKDNAINLTVRFLINPKKVRYIDSQIWEKILDMNKKGEIKLYFSE